MLEKFVVIVLMIMAICEMIFNNPSHMDVLTFLMAGFIYLNVKDKGQVIELEITKEEE